MEKKEYKCSCGYIAKTAQGLLAHQRLKGCASADHIVRERQRESCEHELRKLTVEEKSFFNRQQGKTIGELGFLWICQKCKELV